MDADEKLELLKVWMNRYIMFVGCKDQIKYTSFDYKKMKYAQGVSTFEELVKMYDNADILC